MHVTASTISSYKFQPREGITAGCDRFFSYNRITGFDRFQVPSVILVTGLVDAKSKRRDNETRDTHKTHKGFDEVLKETLEDMDQEAAIVGQTTGYTKDARSIRQNAKPREYSV